MGPLLQYLLDHWYLAILAVGVAVFLGVLGVQLLARRVTGGNAVPEPEPDETSELPAEPAADAQVYVPGVGWVSDASPAATPSGAAVKGEATPIVGEAVGEVMPGYEVQTAYDADELRPSFTPAPAAVERPAISADQEVASTRIDALELDVAAAAFAAIAAEREASHVVDEAPADEEVETEELAEQATEDYARAISDEDETPVAPTLELAEVDAAELGLDETPASDAEFIAATLEAVADRDDRTEDVDAALPAVTEENSEDPSERAEDPELAASDSTPSVFEDAGTAEPQPADSDGDAERVDLVDLDTPHVPSFDPWASNVEDELAAAPATEEHPQFVVGETDTAEFTPQWLAQAETTVPEPAADTALVDDDSATPDVNTYDADGEDTARAWDDVVGAHVTAEPAPKRRRWFSRGRRTTQAGGPEHTVAPAPAGVARVSVLPEGAATNLGPQPEWDAGSPAEADEDTAARGDDFVDPTTATSVSPEESETGDAQAAEVATSDEGDRGDEDGEDSDPDTADEPDDTEPIGDMVDSSDADEAMPDAPVNDVAQESAAPTLTEPVRADVASSSGTLTRRQRRELERQAARSAGALGVALPALVAPAPAEVAPSEQAAAVPATEVAELAPTEDKTADAPTGDDSQAELELEAAWPANETVDLTPAPSWDEVAPEPESEPHKVSWWAARKQRKAARFQPTEPAPVASVDVPEPTPVQTDQADATSLWPVPEAVSGIEGPDSGSLPAEQAATEDSSDAESQPADAAEEPMVLWPAFPEAAAVEHWALPSAVSPVAEHDGGTLPSAPVFPVTDSPAFPAVDAPAFPTASEPIAAPSTDWWAAPDGDDGRTHDVAIEDAAVADDQQLPDWLRAELPALSDVSTVGARVDEVAQLPELPTAAARVEEVPQAWFEQAAAEPVATDDVTPQFGGAAAQPDWTHAAFDTGQDAGTYPEQGDALASDELEARVEEVPSEPSPAPYTPWALPEVPAVPMPAASLEFDEAAVSDATASSTAHEVKASRRSWLGWRRSQRDEVTEPAPAIDTQVDAARQQTEHGHEAELREQAEQAQAEAWREQVEQEQAAHAWRAQAEREGAAALAAQAEQLKADALHAELEREQAAEAAHRAELARREAEQADLLQRERDRRVEEMRQDAQRQERAIAEQQEAARKAASRQEANERRAREKAERRAVKEARKVRVPRRVQGPDDELRAAAAAMLAAAQPAAPVATSRALQVPAAHAPAPVGPALSTPGAEEPSAFVIGSSRRAAANVDHAEFDLPEPLPRPLKQD